MYLHRPAPALPEQSAGRRPARRGSPAPHEVLNVRYAPNATIKRPSSLQGQDRKGVPLAGKAVQKVIQERISMLTHAEYELRLHNHELYAAARTRVTHPCLPRLVAARRTHVFFTRMYCVILRGVYVIMSWNFMRSAG